MQAVVQSDLFSAENIRCFWSSEDFLVGSKGKFLYTACSIHDNYCRTLSITPFIDVASITDDKMFE